MNEVDVIALRKYIGLKQTEFSDKLGIAQSYLSEIERGLKPLTDEVHNKIVNAFKSDLEGYLKFKSDNIANNKGSVNTGTVGGSIVTGNNNTIGDKDARILLLENEVKYLKEMLAEKERFIQSLLNK